MKKLLFTLIAISCFHIYSSAQNTRPSLRLNAEIDILQPFFGGFGGTLGLEKGHLGIGLMGFSTRLSKPTRDFIMKDAEPLDVHNWGIEVYGDYFFKNKHKGFYVGGLVSLDGYEMKTEGKHKGSIKALYLVPRVGYRWIPVPKKNDWIYIQPSFAVPIKVWDDANSFVYQEVTLSQFILLPMLTIGVRLNLEKKLPESN